jgi:hypothetical protein
MVGYRVMLEGAVIDTAIGAPQGAVISPLLSNIYVHPLDLCWEREVRGTKMVRYAGDLVVLCRWRPAKIIKTRIVPAAEGPSLIPGGAPNNPLGAAVMTLAGGEYAIHGTNNPGSIGGSVS